MKRLILFLSAFLAVVTCFCTFPTTALAMGEDIDVLIVIDTDYLKNNIGPGGTEDDPKGLNHHDIDHESQHMVVDKEHLAGGQGSADLQIKAGPRDRVHFRAVSTSANADDAVIVYAVDHWNTKSCYNHGASKHLMNPPTSNVENLNGTSAGGATNGAVMPKPGGNGLPAIHKPATFASLDTELNGNKGWECFYVKIALYTLNEDYESQSAEPYGYYYWDPAIEVQ